MNAYSFLLNQIGPVDSSFFIICLIIIAAIVAIYFLLPVFRKSQYEERRENLRKREAAFRRNKGLSDENDNHAVEEGASLEQPTSKEE